MHRTTALRLGLGAILLLALAGLASVLATQAQAGAADLKLTVNSVANTDDGACTGTPNTTLGGNCTLHEAIDAVNAGLANTINFHLATFPKAQPGVINLEGGLGCLPVITRPVSIQAKDVGVILDGDGNNDLSALSCGGVFEVHATANGFNFEINGKNASGTQNITFREFDGDTDGIRIDGDDGACVDPSFICSLGVVVVRGVRYLDGDAAGSDDYDSSDLLDIRDVSNISSLTVQNNVAVVDDDGVDVDIDGDGTAPNDKILTTHIKITENNFIADFDLNGAGDAVQVDISDGADIAPGAKVTVQVNDNHNLTSLSPDGDDGVDIEICDECDASGASINVQVNNNTKIHGGTGVSSGGRGVEIDIDADDAPTDGAPTHVDVQVNGNGLTDAGDDGVNVDVDICCDNSGSTSNVQVNGNDDVIGGNDGVEVDVDVGCGDANDSVVEVNDNGRVEGQTDDGVDVNVDVGDVASGCSADQADENTSLVQVNGNDHIDGGGAEGVDIDNDTGGSDGNGDDNVSTTEVMGNAGIVGSSEGIEIDSDSGCETCSDADDNTTIVRVEDNGDVRGGAEGVNVSADSGVEDFPSAIPGGGSRDADDNLTEVHVLDNESIIGGGDDGVELDLQSGGDTSGSVRNANVANVNGNGSIEGRVSSSGDGVDISMDVCCDAANTNTVNVNENGDITGRNDGGVDVTLCCSFNVVSIMDNGQIRGNGDDGIDIDVEDKNNGIPPVSPCPEDCGLWSSVTILTISGNDIFNSGEQGIDIRAGAMQFPTDTGALAKSVITNNQIHHNRDDGIELENSFGLNIFQNEIFSNGDDPSADAGVKVTTDCCGFPVNLIPGNANTISQNSIYDNAGLGIDLVGDTDKDGFVGETGIGCNPFPGALFGPAGSPNDCIPFPTILTQSGDKLVGTSCSACHIEVFIADATPADQPLLGTQHGEGRTYLVTGTADVAGNWSIILPCGIGAEQLTTTATDKTKNTSEFSQNFTTLGTSSCVPPTPTVTNTVPAPPTATVTNTPIGGPATPTSTTVPPAATATPTSTTPPVEKICGDVNLNGVVNSIDANLILQLKAALISELANERNADVNNSGDITSVDAALVLQAEAGLIGFDDLVCPPLA